MNKQYVIDRGEEDLRLVEQTRNGLDRLNMTIVPTLKHCLGQSRLLGQFYALSINELLPLKDQKLFVTFHELCIFLRSYVVVDDFQRDSASLCDAENRSIEAWLKNIEQQVKNRLVALESPPEIFDLHMQRMIAAYTNPTNYSDYDLIQEKCGLIYVPLSLRIIGGESFQKESFKKAVGDYLFLLQLVDDFVDIEEDEMSPQNHNVYSRKLRTEEVVKLLKNRALIASPLFSFISGGCRKIMDDLPLGIFKKFMLSSFDWSMEEQKKVPFYNQLELLGKDYFNNPSTRTSLFLRKVNSDTKSISLSGIGAEYMHSIIK
jgi:hypothetical protein